MSELRSRVLRGVFEAFFRPWMTRIVGDVHVVGDAPATPPEGPLLLCANHPSWWDGFLIRELQRRLWPGATLHTLVLASEVDRHPFLQHLGAVPVEPGSIRSLRSTLRRLEALRTEDPAPVVCLFPQGRIVPSHRRPLGFRSGLRLFRRALGHCPVLPVGVHLEFFARPAAHAFLALGPVVAPRVPDHEVVDATESAVQAELDALHHFLALHGEDAPGLWPGPGRRLPRAPAPPRPARTLPLRLHRWPSPN